jgi:hypothetical protein
VLSISRSAAFALTNNAGIIMITQHCVEGLL